MSTIHYRAAARVVVAAHGEQPPTQEDWDAYMSWIRDLGWPFYNVLVISDGTGPNAGQRASLKTLDMKAAVITSSMVVRGMTTAAAWLGVPIRAFTPLERADAARFLDARGADIDAVLEALGEVRALAAGAAGLSELCQRLHVGRDQAIALACETTLPALRKMLLAEAQRSMG